MKIFSLIGIILCYLISYSSSVMAKDMLTEPALRQCIAYSKTLDVQEKTINDLSQIIEDTLSFINLSEIELTAIKSQIDALDNEQDKEVELVKLYNDLNDERNHLIEEYKEAHKEHQYSVQIYTAALDKHNQECINVKVSKMVYDKACKASEKQGFCQNFTFN